MNPGSLINNKTGYPEHIQLDAKTLHQLVEVSELLYQETDLEKISEILLLTIRQILQVDSVALFVFDPEKGKYINFKHLGNLILDPSSLLFREIIQDVERPSDHYHFRKQISISCRVFFRHYFPFEPVYSTTLPVD